MQPMLAVVVLSWLLNALPLHVSWTNPLLMNLENNDVSCFAINVLFRGHNWILKIVLMAILLSSDSEGNEYCGAEKGLMAVSALLLQQHNANLSFKITMT
jgi:hypothetical protein